LRKKVKPEKSLQKFWNIMNTHSICFSVSSSTLTIVFFHLWIRACIPAR